MEENPKVYFTNIEPKIIEMIEGARSSVHIAVAWFTSRPIKEALIRLKKRSPEVVIEVVVDHNEVNEKYFLNTKDEFLSGGIVINDNWRRKFLHRKFMVIDGKSTLMGSYNFTNKAKFNQESIAMYAGEKFAKVHLRMFSRMTDPNYVDENIQLLLEFPDFAQQLMSTYYPFKRTEHTKYKDKILIGSCFTYDVGNYDEIAYTPGMIFNPKYKLDRKLRDHEFPLPISRTAIKNWIGSRDSMLIIDAYRDYPEYYDQINPSLLRSENELEEYFKRIFESTYSYSEIKKKIEDHIDVIKENRLWVDNFELFLDDHLLEKIFASIKLAKNDYWIDFVNEINAAMLSLDRKTKKP